MPNKFYRNTGKHHTFSSKNSKTAIFEEKPELAQSALDAFPVLKNVYNEETGNKLAIFYLKDATAEFRTMMDIKESYKF